LRITFLCPHLRIAGGVRAILTYAARLAARGHAVTVVVAAKSRRRALWRTLRGAGPAWMPGFGARVRWVPWFTPGAIPAGDVVVATAWQSAAAVAGDSVGYWLGRLTGEGVLRTYCRLTLGSGKCVRRAASYYQLHGRKTVVFGRFVMGARAFLPALAGSAGMPFVQFLLFDVLGALVWAGLFITLGYSVGWNPARVHEGYRGVSIALLATVGVGLVAYLAVKLARRGRHGAASLHASTIARVGRSLHLNSVVGKESQQCARVSERQS